MDRFWEQHLWPLRQESIQVSSKMMLHRLVGPQSLVFTSWRRVDFVEHWWMQWLQQQSGAGSSPRVESLWWYCSSFITCSSIWNQRFFGEKIIIFSCYLSSPYWHPKKRFQVRDFHFGCYFWLDPNNLLSLLN